MDKLFRPGSSSTARSSGRNYGMNVFVNRDPLASEAIDIVAVHGLNGHYEKTWTNETSQFNWLKDGIPKVIPLARVMSFSYNSSVQFSKSTSDLFVFADQLLESLSAERTTVAEQDRQIIFICHSLGGLVVKQALVRAHDASNYTDLGRHVSGVVFMGTPHRGSNMASWASTIGRVLKAAALGTSTNTQLAKDLERNSRVLDIVSRTFIDRSRRLKILTFVETDKMDFMKSVVVDAESAVLGLNGETVVHLEGNHRTICRFANIKDNMLKVVLSNLYHMSLHAAEQPNPEETTFLRSLETSNPELHKGRNPPPLNGTCTWLLEHPTYKDWLLADRSSLLWLSADPGCGKSVLASSLIDGYMAEIPVKRNICYFFFKSDNSEQIDAVHCLQAMLRQIYASQPTLTKIGAQEMHGRSVVGLDVLWTAFIKSISYRAPRGTDLEDEAVRYPDARNTLCVIDGLDECEPGSRKAFIKAVSHYFSNLPADSNDSTPPMRFKMLITSRPDISIKVAFDKSSLTQKRSGDEQTQSQHLSMIRLRGEDEVDSISGDLNLVIRAAVAELASQGLPEELLEDVEAEIIARADRTFLWATLILQMLQERVEAGASRRELDEILRSRDIDAVYARLLSGRRDVPRARKLLSVVLAAQSPLTVGELGVALAVTPEHHHQHHHHRTTLEKPSAPAPELPPRRPGRYGFDDVEYDLVYPFEHHIKALCGHFVRIIRDRVYLVHETAREFLLEADDRVREGGGGLAVEGDAVFAWEDDASTAVSETGSVTAEARRPTPALRAALPWQNSFSLDEAHALLLEICVTYIYCMGKPSRKANMGEPSVRTSAFLQYAATNWGAHFREVQEGLDSRDLAYYFNLCHPRFPGFRAWIEYVAERFEEVFRGSDDETQDYFVENYLLRDSLGRSRGPDPLRYFSSNPASMDNHNFSLSINRQGFVSLNYRKSNKQAGGK